MRIRPWTGIAAGLALATTAAVLVATPSGAAEDHPGGRQLTLTGRGSGDGVGLSMSGTRGAEAAGLTDRQILDHYYPGSAAGTVPTSNTIRVRLATPSETTLTVLGAPGLQVREELTGAVTPLPDVAARYRITSAGTELRVTRSADGGDTWSPVPLTGGATGSTGDLTFAGAAELRPLYQSRTDQGFEGSLTAVRSAGTTTVAIVNTVTVDQYVAARLRYIGPLPAAAGLRAFATALRGWSELRRGAPGSWDVCSTDGACTLTNGFTSEGGALTYLGRWRHSATTDAVIDGNAPFLPAVTATAGQVRTAGGAPVGRWTLGNGGWTVSGGVPWLPAKQDPYEPATGPYTTWSTPLGFRSGCLPAEPVGRVSVLTRDGNGPWGGRVTSMRVAGTTTAGSAWQRDLAGAELARCVQAPSTLFTILADWKLSGSLAGVRAPDGGADIVAVAPGGELYTRHQTPAGDWEPWQAVGGRVVGNTAIERSASGALTAWATGSNGALYSVTRDAAGWGAWRSWGGGLLTGPSVATLADGTRVVVAVGRDRAVWAASWSRAGTFLGWRSLGGAFEAWRPSVTASGLVFGTAPTMAVYTRPYAAGSWTRVGGAVEGGPAAVSTAPGTVEVYVKGTDRKLWTVRSTSGRWGAWSKIDRTLWDGPTANAFAGGTEVWAAVDEGFGVPYRWTAAGGWQRVPQT